MTPEGLIALADRERTARKPACIRCCMAAGCTSSRSEEIKATLEQAVATKGLADQVEVRRVGCMGLCGQGPLVRVDPGDLLYEQVTPETAPSIVDALVGGTVRARRGDPQHPFFTRQRPVVLARSGRIDPERIEDYLEAGGYRAFHRALSEMQPAQVITAIAQSGLRARGGAGYPTGLKWATVAKAAGGRKFVVCNGDEGDPGAFMDRSVLESDPHAVIEGMAIAGWAVGANEGFIYVRAEYPLAVSRLQVAIRQAKQHGLLGTAILESPFNFDLNIRIGASAFVCGEETALMASIEARRGQPRPPYPAEAGLWGCPTLINIVEGKAVRHDLEQLEQLCDLVRHTSLCGLGQTAPNPVLSTLRYFRHEYLEGCASTAA